MRILITLIFAAGLISCSNQNKLTPEAMAESACDCFEKLEVGSIDDRLSPCLSEPINENVEQIYNSYQPDKPVETALEDYMMEVSIIMIHNCDKFYVELDSMYTDMYPEIEYSSIQPKLQLLSDSINGTQLSDTSKIALLHEKISLLTKARKFDEALASIDQMSNEFLNESETYWVRAYIYRFMGKYDLAIGEIDKAIASGNEGSMIFRELIKRNKNGR